MQPHVALIIHHPDSNQNRIADLLLENGHPVKWYCPQAGDSLPEDPWNLAGAVLLGGPMSANDDAQEQYLRDEYRWMEHFLGCGRPFLGICLGAQMLARVAGGTVAPHPGGLTEVGYYPVTSTQAGRGLLGPDFHAFHWHREGIRLPPGSGELLARGELYDVQAFRIDGNIYGLQFHPEVTRDIFERWIQEAPHCFDWPGAQSPEQIRQGWGAHDGAIELQLSRFLEHWIGPGEQPQ